MSNQIVLIDCPDAKGLVFNITKVFFDLGLNIISNHEYVDPNSKYFFMRTVLEGNHPEEEFNNKL
ncbi:MAG: ACT domain-containing protein, partial [Bacteroidetes bacterium]|nr:ACT domain-containing protein [Bacteroidota bacterium]